MERETMGSGKLLPFIFSILIALIFLNLPSKFTAQNVHSPPARPITPPPPPNNKQYTVKSWRRLPAPPSRPESDHPWPNDPVRKSPPPPF
ncbi:unnamed protein product [Citrullus colocynthis]|uniref:Transmembrane protein n=1 Tax=Citrullus colocynthis TaxID=252529 RepID=A0ABP0Y1Q0_9ROSI